MMTQTEIRNELLAWGVSRDLIRTALHAGMLRDLHAHIMDDTDLVFPDSI